MVVAITFASCFYDKADVVYPVSASTCDTTTVTYSNQIVSILNQQESGRSVRDICREHAIAEGTFYQWKNKYGGMVVNDVKRLNELEEENSDLSGCLLI